ncbi:MAG: glycosyltransferase [Holosporales bacterium]|jgi:glycosyltransferase involved in cell wall biosynthesis|nr:glycosyltransferase [Holosporales bacterium]
MLKILHVCSGKGLGGTRSVFIAYQKLFEKLGIDSTPVIRRNAQIKNELISSSLQKLEEISYTRRLPIKWQKVSKAMKNLAHTQDLIWVHKPIDARIWRSLSPEAKIVMVVHGFQNTNLGCANYLIAVSQPVFDHLQKKGLDNVFLINNFLSMPISQHEISWNKRITISSFGFFRRKKGFTDFIRALRILKKTISPDKYSVNIYGNGRLEIILKAMKLLLNIKNLQINNWTTDVKTCLKNTDILVIPSRSESFSMMTIEGMSQGCLVVATKCKGPEFIIANEVNGILIEKQNPQIMADTLKRIIESPELFTKIRESGRRMLKNKFNINNSKQSLNNVLGNILYV